MQNLVVRKCPAQRHDKFYYNDGNVVFEIPGQPSNMLFKLYVGVLVSRSPLFETLFSIPPDMGSRNAEGTDEHPITMWGMTPKEFEVLAEYLFGGYSDVWETEDFLVALLKLSVFLQIKDGEEFAITHLPRLAVFHPALQIQLARSYRVDHWVEPAFRQLLAVQLHTLDQVTVNRIGLHVYHILSKTKTRIDEERRLIAFHPPIAQNDPSCDVSLSCIQAWEAEWWSGMARQLMHPEAPLTGRQILAGLDDVSRIPAMCQPCQDRSVAWLKNSGVFLREEKFVDEAVAELLSWQTDEPIRAGMRDIVVPDPESLV
ncbi:hypothetical protein PLICRDRAFT_485165 [Plicaturopsis crispa FD-325 SS-3]|nr:hypothetical protein PLICRDRAFT_485165 [Plicaturopsis crispa FD-325 SS-3]